MVPPPGYRPGPNHAIHPFGHRAGKRGGRTGEATGVKPPSKASILDNSSFQGKGTVKVGSNLNCNITTYNADMQGGTSSLMDHYWMCGARLHMQLPPNWNGLCSLVTLHIPSLVIPGVDISQLHDHPMSRPTTLLHHYRTKRAAEFLGTEVWKDVPQEHRLFNDAQIFFGSILPFIQVKATARWLQITRFELMKTINATEDGFNAIKEELRALRLMIIQHRYVLDLVTAMEGGVCKKIGLACCTYVPANDADNGTLTQAIQTLHDLQKKMIDEGGAADRWFEGWFEWVPSWMSGLFKALLPLIVLLLFMCLILQVIIACCKRMTAKLVGTE
ncbi:syncytin-2-like [Pleurodeles waltl]|uniref:syncytin-2-like n=1 Tax=Pleurodeles waltl TaxID=8319 RepID=UPI003709AEE3